MGKSSKQGMTMTEDPEIESTVKFFGKVKDPRVELT
jgi:hypothetical protein